MQAKTILVNLFIALAMALPSPADNEPGVVQAKVLNPEFHDADLSAMAIKSWQAAGGCKRDWDEDRRCVNQCIGEANSKCSNWKSMTGVIQGGCVPGWNTCGCICEY
jgi:hypothetical protein